MKFKVLLLLMLFTAGLTACKKESKNDAVSIVGKWYVTAIKVSTFTNGVESIGTDATHFDTEYYFTFDDNNGGVEHSPDPYFSYMPFTYSLTNSTLTVKPMLLITHNSKFTVDKLTNGDMTFTAKFNNSNGSYTLEVVRLSQTRPDWL